jgi:chemotaxis protein histidine kinase CheA
LEGRTGIAVDALCGEAQVVIKPLGRPFGAVAGLAGSTILGNGRVALILDVVALIEAAVLASRTPLSSRAGLLADRSRTMAAPKAAPKDSELAALIS